MPEPGDLVFAHSKGVIGWAIRFGERLRSPLGAAKWNHVAVYVGPTVVQATARGVTSDADLVKLAPGGKFEVVKCPVTADPERVVAFAQAQVGRRYGFLTIASIVANLVTPRFVSIRRPDTWICSALGAAALWYGGWPKAEMFSDVYQITPADLYELVR